MMRLGLVLLLVWCSGARAASLAGTTFPDTYPVAGQTLVLNGIGLRTLTLLEIKVYVAGLYVAQKSHDAQAIINSATPKVLLLQFLHTASREQIEKQFHTGEVVNCGDGGCNRDDQADFDKMVAAAPAVKPGDSFTFLMDAHGVRFFADKDLVAQSDKADLGRLILLGFIGSHPPSEELRRALLE